MGELKDELVQLAQQNAQRKTAEFAVAYMGAESEEKQTLVAAMEIERWLAETCRLCLG
jgi:hypothetical protein